MKKKYIKPSFKKSRKTFFNYFSSNRNFDSLNELLRKNGFLAGTCFSCESTTCASCASTGMW